MNRISYIQNFEQWKEEFNFSIDISIRFSETDMFGHVNNVSPFIYFEQGRIEYLKHCGLYTTLDKTNTIPIVADLQCDYVKEIFFGDTIQLFVKTASVGNSSLDLHYMAVDKKDDAVCLTGRGRLVNIHPKLGTPIPLTEIQKSKLLTF